MIDGAEEMRDRLAELGLESFCKTTGGKGLHVVTPLARPRKGQKLDWATAKQFARNVCSQMASDSPDRYLINMSKAERRGKIFLDYLRNDQFSTAVEPLSPRAVRTRRFPCQSSGRRSSVVWIPCNSQFVPFRSFSKNRRPGADYCRAERSPLEAIARLTKQSRLMRAA